MSSERQYKIYTLNAESIPAAILSWEQMLADGADVTRPEQEEAFFVYLEATLDATHAARKACIPMGTLRSRRKRSEKFEQRWADALDRGKGNLRRRGRQLAMDGHAGMLKYFLDRESPEETIGWRLKELELELEHELQKELAAMAQDTQLPEEVLEDQEAMELIERLNARIELLTGNPTEG